MNETDALGDGERRGVPADAVEDEADDPVGTGAGLAGEEREVSSKSALSTPVARCQMLSPVAGETKAVT